MPDPITLEQRLAEIRDLRVDSCCAEAPYNPDVWALENARGDLLAEVDRLNAQIVTHDRLNRVAIGDWEREVDRLRAELAEMKSAAADWAGRLTAQKDRADRSANRTRGLMRTAIRRIGELGQLRDAVADSDPIRAERLAFAIEEIRALFKRETDGGEAP